MNSPGEKKPTFSHLSHHHLLELTGVQNNGQVSCSGCGLPILGVGDYYTCRPCSFSLHSTCFKMPASLRHPSHPAHELSLAFSVTTAVCRACAHQIAPAAGGGGGGFSYGCQTCAVKFHSLCIFRADSITHSFHPIHELSLKYASPYGAGVGFRCDVCGRPGLPDQWLYRCDLCDFDIHAECSSESAVTTTRSTLPAGSPGGAPPPAGYPPTGYGLPYLGPSTLQAQLQQPPPPAIGMGINQAQPHVVGYGYQQQHAGIGTGTTHFQPQVIGGGYPHTVAYPNGQMIGAGPVAPGTGMGMGTLAMNGIVSGVGQGIGQGIVESTLSGFGHDSSLGQSE